MSHLSNKSPDFNSSNTLTSYFGSRRGSANSTGEAPQEVSPAHVKFVRDTSKYWYKPAISREEGRVSFISKILFECSNLFIYYELKVEAIIS